MALLPILAAHMLSSKHQINEVMWMGWNKFWEEWHAENLRDQMGKARNLNKQELLMLMFTLLRDSFTVNFVPESTKVCSQVQQKSAISPLKGNELCYTAAYSWQDNGGKAAWRGDYMLNILFVYFSVTPLRRKPQIMLSHFCTLTVNLFIPL